MIDDKGRGREAKCHSRSEMIHSVFFLARRWKWSQSWWNHVTARRLRARQSSSWTQIVSYLLVLVRLLVIGQKSSEIVPLMQSKHFHGTLSWDSSDVLSGIELVQTVVMKVFPILSIFVISVETDEESSEKNEEDQGNEEDHTTVGMKARVHGFDVDDHERFQFTIAGGMFRWLWRFLSALSRLVPTWTGFSS